MHDWYDWIDDNFGELACRLFIYSFVLLVLEGLIFEFLGALGFISKESMNALPNSSPLSFWWWCNVIPISIVAIGCVVVAIQMIYCLLEMLGDFICRLFRYPDSTERFKKRLEKKVELASASASARSVRPVVSTQASVKAPRVVTSWLARNALYICRAVMGGILTAIVTNMWILPNLPTSHTPTVKSQAPYADTAWSQAPRSQQLADLPEADVCIRPSSDAEIVKGCDILPKLRACANNNAVTQAARDECDKKITAWLQYFKYHLQK